MAVDFQKYTRRTAVRELTAVENHLRGFIGDEEGEERSTEAFCLECIAKHLSHLGALAEEGVTFFPKDAKWWKTLSEWVEGIFDEGEDGRISSAQIRRWMDQARTYRKELQAMYMGNFGRCKCVTGLEPCCHGRKQKAVN